MSGYDEDDDLLTHPTDRWLLWGLIAALLASILWAASA
jgi:hypothetical protein